MNVESLLRSLAPDVLGALMRRYSDFAACEDAVQEALLAAALQWPSEGVPSSPRGWLITVASRRFIEVLRTESARRRRETNVFLMEPPPAPIAGEDDTLQLFLLCCHPSLTPASQVALTLRAVGGLTTAEIARAYLVPETTIAQRISRAKAKIKDVPLNQPGSVSAVLDVLYLIFNEGHTASSGSSLNRVELSDEAIRLTRQVHARAPEGEVAGLLALMLLTDARRPARTNASGALIPLEAQDRSRWDSALIAEGSSLIESVLSTEPPGPYQLQAAIAAVHDEALSAADTDWPQILGLYDVLARLAPGPMVTLNRIVALAMVEGPRAGLAQLATADLDHFRVDAVRAHLLEMSGDREGARAAYRLAAERTLSTPERRYLRSKADRGHSD
ncbi:RNA polymerase sigma factor [Lentzea tibetensis]|uniref:RNA polymerase sigma factor n=1 Tax=Lentzea tibetensis TaxID=2591470 RepID=UPI001C992E94|nr:sigma-70 family RNA polymerase sigma factor [Lentzea tibetensis]